MNTTNIRNRRGQRLDAAFHPAAREDAVVVIGHGVTGNKDRPLLVGIARALADRGIPCLRFSFAGNGASEGRFEEATISAEAEDLEAALDAVSELGARRIAYLGHSMGAAVGTLVAARSPDRIHVLVSIAGMVDVAGFFRREFGEVVPGEGFMWDEPGCPLSPATVDDANAIGSTLTAAEAVAQPWLFIHGSADDVVPLSDSQEAYAAAAAAAQKRLLEMPGQGHMFSESAYAAIADAVVAWIDASPPH